MGDQGNQRAVGGSLSVLAAISVALLVSCGQPSVVRTGASPSGPESRSTPASSVTSATTAPKPLPSAPPPTSGPIPEDAWKADGSIDLSRVPEYIPVSGHGEEKYAGYVKSSQYFDPDRPFEAVFEVFGDDLKTLIGHFHPNVGFVALGKKPSDYPATDATVIEDESKSPSATAFPAPSK
jgi:hypothetical protein